ncbi:RNA polymerase sigma factor [Heyndrickxia sporothermodurans]
MNRKIEEWYDEYSYPIFKFILLMIQDYQQSEDLTQETFVKAYKNYHSFKGNSSPKTWLFSIAHNLTIDYLRKRRPITLIKEIFLLKRDSNKLPDEVIVMKENSKELYYALKCLKDSYREVIILRKIKEFSIEETAYILNWTESKVKATLHRAIPALEKQFKKEGFLNERMV